MRRGTLFAVAVAVAVAAPARADKKADARTHYKDGQKFYDLGKFNEAIVEFEAGYQIFPDAAFLFNLGQCHRMLGNADRALFYYRGFLRNKPDAPNRPDVERIIKELEGRSGTEPAPVPAPVAPPPEPPPPAETPPPEPPPAAEAPPDAGVATQAPSKGGPSRTQKILAWSTVGAGVALVGVGVLFGVQARGAASDYNECLDGGVWTDCADARDRHDSKKKLAMLTVGVGAAVGIGGGLWVWMLSRSAPAPASALRIDFSPGGAIVGYGSDY